MNLLRKIVRLFGKKKVVRHFYPPEDYSHLYNADDLFAEEFYTNLAKTIGYTENIISKIEDVSNVNYTTILRSVNPVYEGRPFYTFTKTTYGYIAEPVNHPFNYNIILKEALHVRENAVLPKADIKRMGRILRFEKEATTYDGAASAEGGFVDHGDCPPIDTWFYVTKRYLYCWMPAMFFEAMQNAIEVEPLDSYQWLDESDPHFYLHVFQRLNEMRPIV